MRASRAALLAALLPLAACGGGSNAPSTAGTSANGGSVAPSSGGFFNYVFGSGAPISCPQVTKIGEAARLTRFAGSGHDVTDVLFEAAIGDINGKCSISDNAVNVQMTADFIASRGPADKSHKAVFAYFVAITDNNENILARQVFDTTIPFPGNRTRNGVEEQLEQIIPLRKGQQGSDFHIFIGFVLTPQEVAYNRAHP